MPGLTKLRQFKDDKSGCWASVILASGEPCWISVAGGSVVVKRSRLGLFGAPLYKEGDIYKNTMIVKAIAQIFPARALPAGRTDSDRRYRRGNTWPRSRKNRSPVRS